VTKDEWIQKAKALLFDAGFCVDSAVLRREMQDLIQHGGGYNPETESSATR